MLAIFSLPGKVPDGKDVLQSTDRLFPIQSFDNFVIFIRMLLGPVALLLLKSNIMSMITNNFMKYKVHILVMIHSLCTQMLVITDSMILIKMQD